MAVLRWGARRGRPPWARWVGAGYALGFLEGTGAHLLDLVRGGLHAYASFGPVPLQAFFVALVLLDPSWPNWWRSRGRWASNWRRA
ncbi:hypothetical protein [Streptomyces sp. NPDC101150]|uniref:hypothetical protein n=1 Tax=Streptomyces sp. NPDC101150 TaxID=3366114 RepID=UPI0037F1EE97